MQAQLAELEERLQAALDPPPSPPAPHAFLDLDGTPPAARAAVCEQGSGDGGVGGGLRDGAAKAGGVGGSAGCPACRVAAEGRRLDLAAARRHFESQLLKSMALQMVGSMCICLLVYLL